MLIPILLGSESDREHAKKITDELDKFGIPHEVRVISAHKVPELCVEYIKETNKKEDVVYITCAGRSNGLSGVISGSAVHPVIACPPFSDKADYLANIHSSVLMPSDTPAMTVVDPKNAALAAVKILALKDKNLQKKVEERIEKVKKGFKS
ncbi:AIR carboxylase family protein [Candidatus Peregrinibacteria bacterium]|nr:AIR carboxylase family protein [Candidatus Peregrinibacteria bacterium]